LINNNYIMIINKIQLSQGSLITDLSLTTAPPVGPEHPAVQR
jgi:hypothetical protein